jgi:PAS domain S-box-containing protein
MRQLLSHAPAAVGPTLRGSLASPLATGLLIALVAWGSIWLTLDTGRVAALWPANGVHVAILLSQPRHRWLPLALAGLAGLVAAALAVGDTPSLAIALACGNGLEILAMVIGVRAYQHVGRLDFTRPRLLAVFSGMAFLTPVLAAGPAALALTFARDLDAWETFARWYAADALGLLTMTPLLASVRGIDVRRTVEPGQASRLLASLALLAVVLVACLGQAHVPLLFSIFPALVFVVVRHGFVGAALGIAMIGLAALAAIHLQVGPFALMGNETRFQIAVLQVFLALAALTCLQVSAVLAERDRLVGSARAAQRAVETRERRYRTLVEALPHMAWLATPEGVPTYLNTSMRTYFGDVVLDPHLCHRIVHEDDLNAYLVARAEGFTHTRDIDVACRLLRRDGTYRWHGLTVRPIRENGAVVEWVGAAVDIDDQRQAQDDLVVARDRAEAAGRAKADFLANMSHELRTPLTAVIGASELLLSGYADRHPEKRRRYLEMQRDAGTGLLQIINDILDFSKIEAGQMTIETVPFAPTALVEETLSVVDDMAKAKGLKLAVTVDPGIPDDLVGDPMRIRQVLLNLLSNAIKFTPVGGEVMLTAMVARGTTDRMAFVVSDTGIGIAPEGLARLFHRFTQAESTTSRRFGGTGLGLAICRRLASLMGGRLDVDSVVDRGSTFRLVVPMIRTDAVAEGHRDPEPEAYPGRRLLFADDTVINQQIIGETLRQAGHDVTVVGDGAEAVAAAAHGAFDAILMDIQMPEVDGYMATRAIRDAGIRGTHGPIPVIALTANALSDEPGRCFAAGMDRHIPKPVDWPLLFRTIAELTVADRGASTERLRDRLTPV